MKKLSIILLSFAFLMSCNSTKNTTMTQQTFDRNIQPKPGPAPKVNLGKPTTFTLDNGLKVLVVENHKLPRVSVNLTLDNPPLYEGDKAGVSQLLGSLLGSGTENMSKDDFNNRVDFLGSRVWFSSTGGGLSSLTKFFPEVFELLADGALNPKFSQEEFEKEQAKAIDGVKSGEKSVGNISNRVERVLAYGADHPYGEFTTVTSLENLTLGDVQSLYDKYYVPNNGYLVVTGDVTTAEVKPLVEKYFSNWEAKELPEYKIPETDNVAQTQINFIDMPEASQTQVNIVSTTHMTMDDPDYFPLLVANHIFGGDFNSHLNMNLREAHGFTYGARSSVPADRYVSMFRAGAKVRNEVVDSVVVEIMKEVNRMYSDKVTAEELNTVKASYSGRFVMNMEKPETITRYALNIEKNDLPEDFYEKFLENINAVTADDVMRVSQKYFNKDNLRIAVTSKGSEVIPALEKLGYPIHYFDKTGNTAEKPKLPEAASADVTPVSVLNNYYNAVGGKDKLESIKSIQQTYEMQMQGMMVQNVYKMAAPNKINVETIVMGQSYGKMVFDGNEGYAEQMGAKMPLPADQLEEFQNRKGIIEELYLADSGAELSIEGVFPVNGSDAYKMAIKKGDQVSYKYFDKESGLLVREEKSQKGPDGKDTLVPTDFHDYKDINGLKIAHKVTTQAMGQSMEMEIKDLQINPVFDAGTFK
jgi:predicted Zn-dependent peptidase